MNILIDIGHPAHVHLFKNFAWIMQKKGHEVFFTARKKEHTIYLLSTYGFNFKSFGPNFKSIKGKIWGLFKFNFKLLRAALKFKPDILMSHGSIYAAHVSWILRKPHIALEDSGNMEQIRLYKPFSKVILVSTAFHKNLGEKQIAYKGHHELAYLHPNYFKPDPSITELLGLKKGEKFIVFRFVSWTGSHDFGQKGLSFETARKAIKEFSKFARVFISSEGNLPVDLRQYKIEIPPEKMHDALACANLYIGESATMAEESAMLGTPSICISSLAGELGYIKDFQEYNLLYCYNPEIENKAMEKGFELLKNEDIKTKWEKNRQKMLSEKIDVTAFMVWFIENYPDSVEIMKKNPDYQYRFK
jgi:predicted glycosyltransferase